jgi:hypothetical protein
MWRLFPWRLAGEREVGACPGWVLERFGWALRLGALNSLESRGIGRNLAIKESDRAEMLLVGVEQRQECFDTDGQARRIVSALSVYFGPLFSSSVSFRP